MANRNRAPKRKQTVPTMVWDKDSYTRVSPGRYSAVGTRVQGPEWVRAFRRWSIRVEFGLVGEGVPVSAFYNLGNDPDKLHFGRKSKYVHDWTIANGEAPRRGELLTPNVFLQGQIFELEIGDCSKNSEEQDKSESEIYSRVTTMVRLLAPSLHSPNHESVNQESRITQTSNQVINQSRKPSLPM